MIELELGSSEHRLASAWSSDAGLRGSKGCRGITWCPESSVVDWQISKTNMNLLPNDPFTEGALSKFINNSWAASRGGEHKYVTSEQLLKLHQILENFGEQVFGRVAYHVYVPLVDLYKDEYNLPEAASEPPEILGNPSHPDAELERQFVTYFDQEGFILHDGAYAAAGGHYRNIYKAKGKRIFWMRDQTIRVCSLHATINNDGFNLYCEELDRFSLSETDYSELYKYLRPWGLQESAVEQVTDAKFWISSLSNINVPYEKVFYLEHLLNPADVHHITTFSERVRAGLWHSILELAKRITTEISADLSHEKELFTYSLRLMSECGVELPVAETIAFFDYVVRSRIVGVPYEQFSEILQELKRFASSPPHVQNFYGPVGTVQNGPGSNAYVEQMNQKKT